MKTYPLKSLDIYEAMHLQFELVDAITKFFPGHELLTKGDLGVLSNLNQPLFTKKVEDTLAYFFNAEDAMLIRGAGTNAIRMALYAGIGQGGTLLVHDAPIYPTTQVSIDMLGIKTFKVDFNDLNAVKNILSNSVETIDGVLIQITRQKLDDSYDSEKLIKEIKKINKNIFIITDDNYSVMKTKGIGTQFGSDISCFSTFKLLGPEGIGCIVGSNKVIKQVKKWNYSGGGQVQGHEALDVLRGMVYAPVALAISAQVSKQLCDRLNHGEIDVVEKAYVVNAQSKVVVVKLKQNIAKEIICNAPLFGALPHPVGAESKYEIAPLIYRVSGTFLQSNAEAELNMIRINPNRSGVDTIINILHNTIKSLDK